MYREVTGDLIKLTKEETFDVIVHGCNCHRRMGSGIALTLKKNFPEIYQQDLITNKNVLGEIDEVRINDYNFNAINAYTQDIWGKPIYPETKQTRYDAIRSCMRKINSDYKGSRVGLPKIGCGLAGGDWSVVKDIIMEEMVDCDVTVVIWGEKEKDN